MADTHSRRVILFIAVTLDGYIARENGDIDWLSVFEESGEDYGYREFLAGIDTVIMGRTTYEQVLTFGEFPYPNQKCFVMTSRPDAFEDERVEFYAGSPRALISRLRSNRGADIWLIGGAKTAQAFMATGLIDRYMIAVIPRLLGSGIRLFNGGRHEQVLKMTEIASHPSGLVQIAYDADHAGKAR